MKKILIYQDSLDITASYERFCHILSQTLMTAFIHKVTGLLRVQHLMSLYAHLLMMILIQALDV